jgi:hypothetical protein
MNAGVAARQGPAGHTEATRAGGSHGPVAVAPAGLVTRSPLRQILPPARAAEPELHRLLLRHRQRTRRRHVVRLGHVGGRRRRARTRRTGRLRLRDFDGAAHAGQLLLPRLELDGVLLLPLAQELASLLPPLPIPVLPAVRRTEATSSGTLLQRELVARGRAAGGA